LFIVNIGFWKPMSWIAWTTSVLFKNWCCWLFYNKVWHQTLDIANLLPYSLSWCFHSWISLSLSLATLRGVQGWVRSARLERGVGVCTRCAASTGSHVLSLAIMSGCTTTCFSLTLISIPASSPPSVPPTLAPRSSPALQSAVASTTTSATMPIPSLTRSSASSMPSSSRFSLSLRRIRQGAQGPRRCRRVRHRHDLCRCQFQPLETMGGIVSFIRIHHLFFFQKLWMYVTMQTPTLLLWWLETLMKPFSRWGFGFGDFWNHFLFPKALFLYAQVVLRLRVCEY